MIKPNFLSKLLLVFLFLIKLSLVNAQINKVTVGINGLTCSLCSNSVEKYIRKLAFVDDIKMNLNDNEVEIYFKENKNAEINLIAKKVEEAGFSVRDVKANFTSYNQMISSCSSYTFNKNGEAFYFLENSPITLNGTYLIQFIGKDIMSKKHYNQWKDKIKNCKNISKNSYFVILCK